MKKEDKITDYIETFKDKEIININNNYLINNDSILGTKEEILYANGYFTKNDADNMYVNFDPLSMTSVELANKMIYLLAPCLSATIIQIYKRNEERLKKIIEKYFKRFIGFFDLKKDISGDVMFQMKLIKFILNDKIDSKLKLLSYKTTIKYLEELIHYRNLLSHQVHKKKDYELQKKKSKKRSRSEFHQKHKLRNFNTIKKYISKAQYIINFFYKNRRKAGLTYEKGVLNRNYLLLNTYKKNINYLCLMRERRKKLELLIKDEETLEKIAHSTIDYLSNALKSKKSKKAASRNIVNLITTRMVSDKVLNLYFKDELNNKKTKKYCREL